MIKKLVFLLGGFVLLLMVPHFVLANSPPRLREGGARPSLAEVDTPIVYQVVYSDPDGDSPSAVRVCFQNGKKEMTKVSGDYKKGAVYQYSQVVKEGDKASEFYFEASDGKTTARHPEEQGSTFAPVNILSERLDKNKIYFWDRENSQPLWTFTIGSDWVQNLAISANGNYIAVGTNRFIYLFSRESNKPLWQYDCFSGGEFGDSRSGWVAISADGNYIAGGCQSELYLFHKESNQPLWKHSGNIYNVALSRDGKYIAFGTMGTDDLFLFSRESSKPLWHFQAEGDIHALAISQDGNYIAAGAHCPDRRIYLFSREKGVKPLVSYVASEGSPVWAVAISQDGKYIVYGLDSGETGKSIFLFSPEAGEPLATWSTDWWVRSLAISSDGEYIVAGSGDHNVYLLDKDKDHPLWKFEAGERVGAVAMSQDGSYIVAGSKDKKVYLFAREKREPLWSYQTDSWVNAVAVSADGKSIVAGTGACHYLAEGQHSKFNPGDFKPAAGEKNKSISLPANYSVFSKYLSFGVIILVVISLLGWIILIVFRKKKR